jgi:hypothetical protein
VGRESNVQDGAILHADENHPLSVGERVSVGHAAVLHGCTIGHGTLVGIHATILNDAVIGRNRIVAAGSVIPEGKHFPDRSLIPGTPAKLVRQISDDEIASVLANAEQYVTRASVYKEHLTRRIQRDIKSDDVGVAMSPTGHVLANSERWRRKRMTTEGKTLRLLVKKWLVPTSEIPIRITRFSYTRSYRGRYVRVEALRPA